MLPYRDSRFTFIALVVFFTIAGAYALFEARGLIFGPSILVTDAPTEVHDPYVLIQGQALRIASLSMDGKQIQVTEAGDFAQPYLLAAGNNRIVLDAKDQYGRTREEVIEIVYTPLSSASPSTAAEATSTATTSPS